MLGRLKHAKLLLQPPLCTRALSAAAAQATTSFSVAPGSLLHICCTQPDTRVEVSNKQGVEEAVTVWQAGSSEQDRFLMQQTASGRVVAVVEQAPGCTEQHQRLHPQQQPQQPQQQQQHPGTLLSATIPSRFCGLSVTTAGGGVTVGQLQEADMQLSTAGGDVTITRCRAHNASINTAAAAQQQQQQPDAMQTDSSSSQGGAVQVGELSASRVTVFSGGAAVRIKRLFGLTLDVSSAGGELSIGSVYADRAAISSAAAAAAASGDGACGGQQAGGAAAAGESGRAASAAAASGLGGAAASGTGGVGGALRVGHIACLKGEARLESGGGALEVDGLEGNAVLLSEGGTIKVHLHEQAGRVYLDSAGGDVEAWLTPSGGPMGLQVKAAGGVLLDPALKVTGEVGPTLLFGVTSGDGTVSDITSHTTTMVQQAVAAARSKAADDSPHTSFSSSSSSSGGGSEPSDTSRWKQGAQQVAAWSRQSAGAGGQGQACALDAASSDAAGGASRQLVINAGWGRVELRAVSWMDGLKARMQQRGQ